MIKLIKNTAIIIDAGKGTLKNNAVKYAKKRNIKIFRTDITASLAGLINKSLEMEKIIKRNFIVKKTKDHTLITKGLLGSKDDIIVDNVDRPKSSSGPKLQLVYHFQAP